MIKKNKYLTFLVLGVTLLFLTGCSFTPYHDNFACNKGLKEGRCDSVSNIYKLSFNKDDPLKTEKKDLNKSIDKKSNEQKCKKQINDCFAYINYADKTKQCVDDAIANCQNISNGTKQQIEDILYFQQLRNEQLNQKLIEEKDD